MLNQQIPKTKTGFLSVILLLLACRLLATPKHTSSFIPKGNSMHIYLANFELDSLQKLANNSLLSLPWQGEAPSKFQVQYQLAEVQIAQNQFDEAYESLLAIHQNLPAFSFLNEKLYLEAALSEVALLRGQLQLAIQWREDYLAGMRGMGQCEKEAWAKKRLGRLYLKNRQFEAAKEYYEAAMQAYEKLGEYEIAMAIRQEWGVFNLRKKKYLTAMNCFTTNLEKQRKSKDTLGMMSSLKHLIEINQNLDQPEEMEAYCQEMVQWANSPEFQAWQIGAFLKLGKIEEERDNYGLATEYFLQNQHLLLDATSRPELLYNLRAKRPVYQLIGDYNLSLGNRNVQTDQKVFSLLLFWIRMGEFQMADGVINQWLSSGLSGGQSIRTMRLAYRLGTESLRNQGKFQEAVSTYKQMLREPRLTPRFDPMLNKFMNFQTEAKESHERLLLLFENQQQQLLIDRNLWEKRSLMGGVLLAIVISGFLFYYNRVRKKTNLVLSQKNKLIAAALSEKEMLIREVHHRVKNNLQVVSSLLNLHARKVADPAALGAIREGRDRVKSMAFIHQKLYQVNDVRQLTVSDYVEDLTNYLFTSYQIDPEQIELKTSIDHLELDVDVMVPLGLILNELISNSLKHAFPNGRKGQLLVRFVEKEASFLLEVADTGVGVAQKGSIDKTAGFGYQLIHTFCKKLKGQLTVQHQDGTAIQLSFPKTKLVAA
ncbi:MAG: hypothetical protein HRU41_26030 [Saprospiraceae bacterium]|nr:hypothetical protein [Saprospiraceae bacterium]